MEHIPYVNGFYYYPDINTLSHFTEIQFSVVVRKGIQKKTYQKNHFEMKLVRSHFESRRFPSPGLNFVYSIKLDYCMSRGHLFPE